MANKPNTQIHLHAASAMKVYLRNKKARWMLLIYITGWCMCDRKLHHIEMSASFAISNTKCYWLPIHELSYHIERYFKETKHIRLKDTMNARDIRNTT